MPTKYAAEELKPDHKKSFEALISGEFDNFMLMSCVVNGEQSSVICVITDLGDENAAVFPLYVALTDGMDIRGPLGELPSEFPEKM